MGWSMIWRQQLLSLLCRSLRWIQTDFSRVPLNSPRPERAIIANPIGLVVGQRHSASGPPLLAPLVALGGWLNWILKILEQKVHVLQFIE